MNRSAAVKVATGVADSWLEEKTKTFHLSPFLPRLRLLRQIQRLRMLLEASEKRFVFDS